MRAGFQMDKRSTWVVCGLNLQKIHATDSGSDPMAGMSTRMGDLIRFELEGLNGNVDTMFVTINASALLVIDEASATLYE